MLKQRQTVRMMGSTTGGQKAKKAHRYLFGTTVASPSGSPPRKQLRRPLLRSERPSACSKCRTPTMVDLVSKFRKCGKHVRFGEPDDERPSACKGCRTPTMVDLKSKFCQCGKNMTRSC